MGSCMWKKVRSNNSANICLWSPEVATALEQDMSPESQELTFLEMPKLENGRQKEEHETHAGIIERYEEAVVGRAGRGACIG